MGCDARRVPEAPAEERRVVPRRGVHGDKEAVSQHDPLGERRPTLVHAYGLAELLARPRGKIPLAESVMIVGALKEHRGTWGRVVDPRDRARGAGKAEDYGPEGALLAPLEKLEVSRVM